MVANANGFTNNVWITGDIMARMVNLDDATIPPGIAGVYPTHIGLANHDSATFARNDTTAPYLLASAKQGRPITPFTTEFQTDPGDPVYYWAKNVVEWEFVPYVGTTYIIQAASLSGYTSSVYQDWAAFGAVKYPTVVNPSDIVVYLVGFFRVGYGPGTTP